MKKSCIQAEARRVLELYGLEEARLSSVCTSCFEPKELVLRQGDVMDSLYIVVDGTAKVYINARNGRSLILCYYVSKGILGDVELMSSDRIALSTVIAVSPLRVVSIPVSENELYLRGNIAFMNLIAENLSSKLLNSSTARVASALYSSEDRLCAYILMAEHNGVFSDVLTEVAQSVGISYRHVFRIIHSLCGAGVLEKADSGYIILDREQLRKISSE